MSASSQLSPKELEEAIIHSDRIIACFLLMAIGAWVIGREIGSWRLGLGVLTCGWALQFLQLVKKKS